MIGALAAQLDGQLGDLDFEVVDQFEARVEGLSDVLCGVGVTDSARWGRKGIPCPIRSRYPEGEGRLGLRGPRVPLRSSPTGSRGCCRRMRCRTRWRGLRPEEITGPGGLVTQLAGRVIETALGAELTEHLGYPPGQAPPGGAGNTRNGSTAEAGAHRARDGRDQDAAGPQRAALSRSWSASARRGWPAWMSRCSGSTPAACRSATSRAHLTELYGTEIGRDTISRVTDAVLEDVAAWRTRPLAALYPIVYFDCLMVQRPRGPLGLHAAPVTWRSASPSTATARCSGIWWQETEGAKFWLAVLNDLHQRGVEDVLIACVDGLTGFPEAIEAVFPQAWVQTCIVHQIRSSMRWVSYGDRKKVAAELRPVYAAANADAAEHALAAFDDKWGARYPMIAESWRARWDYIIPFLALPADLRRIVYTTNSIENLNRQIRKAIKTRGHFPDEQAATKLIYLAILNAQPAWKTPYHWTAALRALKIHFGDRIPD